MIMKLYFYFLETPYKEKPHIRIKECEVEEKPKTYKPVDRFPDGYYGSYVAKTEIGILDKHWHERVILTARNDELVKQLFSDYLDKQIEGKQKEIEELQEKLMVVENMEENQCVE